MPDRTMIAAMAMQGLLANPNQEINVWDPGLTDVAVGYADDLIKQLNATAADAPVSEVENASPTLRDLGVSGRAAAPLERMGVSTLAQLAVQSRPDIKEVKGVSAATLKTLDKLLADHGLSWDWTPDAPAAETVSDEDEPEAQPEDDDDDLEDVL